ncbi:MAG: hypothetical protein WBP65_05000 [Candidatus Sulfotelmatobacter sp.]|jgi:CheY-like chemotaxis protein
MNSPTVLYLDDLPQALEFHKATLESHGYHVKIASSGYPALKMLEETPVGVEKVHFPQNSERFGG